MSTAYAAWASAEQRLFEYLVTVLQAVPEVSGFVGEFPRTIEDGMAAQMWCIDIQGGEGTFQIRSAQRPAGCWRFDGEWRGVYASRQTAQLSAGMVLAALPVDKGEVDSVSHVTWAAMPTIERQEFELSPDQGEGGAVLVWAVRIPLKILFGNSAYADGGGN